MAVINMGPGATNRALTALAAYTFIALANPSTAKGKLTQVKLWANSDLTGVIVGTFYGSGTSYTSRASANIGNVSAGSVQTFSGLSIAVGVGDFIGLYYETGNLDASTGTGTNTYHKAGNQFGAGAQTFTASGSTISIEASGVSSLPGIAAVNGVLSANIAKVNGIDVSNIAKVNGIS